MKLIEKIKHFFVNLKDDIKRFLRQNIEKIKHFYVDREDDIKRFIRRNSEFLTIPLGILLWHLFKAYAEGAKLSVYDSGIFQKLIFAVIAVLVIKAFTWFMLNIDQPYLKKYLDTENVSKWIYLDEKQKMFYATFYFALYFAALTLIVVLT
jgi:hypothetical protein